MEQHKEKHRKNLVSDIIKVMKKTYYRISFVILFFLVVVLVLSKCIKIVFFEEFSINSIVINLLSANIIALFAPPIFNEIKNILNRFTENSNIKEEVQSIKDDLSNFIENNDIKDEIKSLKRHLSIEEDLLFYPGFQYINWEDLLENCKEVNLSIFFTGVEWNQHNMATIENYVKNGGVFNLYLPNPESQRNKFYQNQHISETIREKIFRTYKIFKQIGIEQSINFIEEGFNYTFASFTKKNNEKYFMYSPYVNNPNSEYPAIVISVQTARTMVIDYIQKEIDFLKNQSKLPDFEAERYITWDVENNRVFVSMSFDCKGGCQFCYVDTLITDKKKINIVKLGVLLADFIIYDERFVAGINGTKILLGAFSDPLGNNKNIINTIDFVKKLGKYDNIIHIATRAGFGKYKLFDSKHNVLISYSFATFNDKIERNNQSERIVEAEALLKKKYNVSFYIRPIIPDITIKDIDPLIKILSDIKLREIVIGELYFDDRIKSNLNLNTTNVETKKMVLDNQNVLIKNNSSDYQDITNKLRSAGFIVYESSKDLIDNYFYSKSDAS